MTAHTGPTAIPCHLNCVIPEGVQVAEVPPSRHVWSDVMPCPNRCGRTLLVLKQPDRLEGPDEQP